MLILAKKVLRKTRNAKLKLKKLVSAERHFYFNIDTPKKANQENHMIEVEGWVIAKDGSIPEIRIVNNKRVHIPNTLLERVDVMKSYGDQYGEKALYCGFTSSFEFEDGHISIEVKYRNVFRQLKSLPVRYGVARNPSYFYNKNLSWHYAEHQNLIENRKQYFYEDEGEGIQLKPGDPRLMAIYLPQFHPFEENDKAWGKGFTEWTNVTSGQPRFIGHEQPVLPSTLGFYDLRLESKIKEQIDLAKKFG